MLKGEREKKKSRMIVYHALLKRIAFHQKKGRPGRD